MHYLTYPGELVLPAAEDDGAGGWYLRSDVIWRKPNAQPESVKDRPTRSHEHVFMLTESERYRYNPDAVREQNDRQLRDVWDINTEGLKDVHFATFPTVLVRRCMALTTREGDAVFDPFLGSGTVGAVAVEADREIEGNGHTSAPDPYRAPDSASKCTYCAPLLPLNGPGHRRKCRVGWRR